MLPAYGEMKAKNHQKLRLVTSHSLLTTISIFGFFNLGVNCFVEDT